MTTPQRAGLTMTLKGSLISHSVTHRSDAKDAEACFFGVNQARNREERRGEQ